VMLNYVKLVVYGFLCSLSFSVLCLSAVGFFERCFPDTYSLALKILRVASIDFRVSARLGGLAQLAI
ncbi:hypothetical protein ABMY03_22165, partial [Vibrio vulnificus]